MNLLSESATKRAQACKTEAPLSIFPKGPSYVHSRFLPRLLEPRIHVGQQGPSFSAVSPRSVLEPPFIHFYDLDEKSGLAYTVPPPSDAVCDKTRHDGTGKMLQTSVDRF